MSNLNVPIFCSVPLHSDIAWTRGYSTGIPKSMKLNGVKLVSLFAVHEAACGLICAVCKANARTLCFTTVCVDLHRLEYVQIACCHRIETRIRWVRNKAVPIPGCELAAAGEHGVEEAGLRVQGIGHIMQRRLGSGCFSR